MAQPRVYSTPAVVLRQRRLGDADKVLTLYTARFGKLDAVAKGLRRTRSRMAGHVEPLTQANVQLARGKSLDVLTQVEAIESFQTIRGDLDRLSRGLYVAELLDKITEPREEHFDLYRLLLDTLRRIDARDDFDTPVRFYEVGLLDTLGYRPELDVCVTCRRPLAAVTNSWSAAMGGVVCPSCCNEELVARPISPNAVKLLRLLVHGRFADVARINVGTGLASELERAMLEYVRWVLERDVRSAEFIDTVRRRARRLNRTPISPSPSLKRGPGGEAWVPSRYTARAERRTME
jgi:DNA repair protein RecO (recombination protein O)